MKEIQQNWRFYSLYFAVINWDELDVLGETDFNIQDFFDKIKKSLSSQEIKLLTFELHFWNHAISQE